MQTFNLPPVFKDFSAGFNSYNLKDTATANVQINNVVQSNNPKFNKKKNKKIIPAVLTALAALGVFISVIPYIRHKKFAQVNPNLIDESKKYAKMKKNYIKFSDDLEFRRNLVFKYFKERFIKVKDLIRKNFFSYNNDTVEQFTPIKEVPERFVKSIIKEINEFVGLCKKVSSKIQIDYTNYTKS